MIPNDLAPLTLTLWVAIWLYLTKVFYGLLDRAAKASRTSDEAPDGGSLGYVVSQVLLLPRALGLSTLASLLVGLVYVSLLPWAADYVNWVWPNVPRLFTDLFTKPTESISYATSQQVVVTGALLVAIPMGLVSLIYLIGRSTRRLLDSYLEQWIEREKRVARDDRWLQLGLDAARRRAGKAVKERPRYEFVFGARGERVLYVIVSVLALVLLACWLVLIWVVVADEFTAVTPFQLTLGVLLFIVAAGAATGVWQIAWLTYLRYFAAPGWVARNELRR